MTTFLLALRNHAMKERNAIASGQVRAIADQIQVAIDALAKSPTHENMTTLNCLWSRAYHYVTQGTSGPGPTSGGVGLKVGALFAEAA